MSDQFKFKEGQRVAKVGGSYQADGVIRARWLTDSGEPRYVFQFDNPSGMVHIFGEHQLSASSLEELEQLEQWEKKLRSQGFYGSIKPEEQEHPTTPPNRPVV